MNPSDQQRLIKRLQNRDKEVIEALYDQYSSSLYGIILRIVPTDDLAQDILQETFIKVWKNASTYDSSKGTLFTWLLNIARNTAIDKTRSANYQRRSKIQDIDQNVCNSRVFSTEIATEHIGLRQDVDNLEEKYKEIIELIYFQGFTQKEVTEYLNIPLGTVKSRVRIALRELRKNFMIRGALSWLPAIWWAVLNQYF